MSRPPPSPSDRKYWVPLDGLRAAAVLVVFLTHSVGDLVPGGFVGVDVFFVLSGFLITSLLVKEWQRHGRLRIGIFYMRRCLRLYPALVVVVLMALALAQVVGRTQRQVTVDAVTALTYTLNFRVAFWSDSDLNVIGHLWSLSVEEQYYLLWPPVLILLLRRGLAFARYGTVALLVACAVVKALGTVWLSGAQLYFLPLGHLDEMLLGSWLGIVLASLPASRLRAFLARPSVPLLAALPLLATALLAGQIQALWLYFGGLLGLGLCSLAIIGHVVAAPASWASRVLSLRPAVWLGVRSYGFYLYHQPVIELFRHHQMAYRYLLPAALVVTCVLVELSWRLVEQPFLRRKRHFTVDRASEVESLELDKRSNTRQLALPATEAHDSSGESSRVAG